MKQDEAGSRYEARIVTPSSYNYFSKPLPFHERPIFSVEQAKPLSFDVKQQLKKLGELTEEEKLLYYGVQLLGEGVPVTGKNVRARKAQIFHDSTRKQTKAR